MQRKIGTEINLGKIASSFDGTGSFSAIDRTTSSFLNASEKVQKIKRLIKTREYDADIAKFIPGTLEFVYQGILEDIDTKEQPEHISYKDMENLEFLILLTSNYYTNSNSIHICFLMKITKATDETDNIDTDLITVNNFLHI